MTQKKITNDQSKIDLAARLVKEGAIDFNEAIRLMEVETEIETKLVPYQPFQPLRPWQEINPYPLGPWQQPLITYGV